LGLGAICRQGEKLITMPTPGPGHRHFEHNPPIPADEDFTEAIYHRLDVDDTIPREGRRARISMFLGWPTLLFPENQGLVLVFEVPNIPINQEETTRAAVMLIGTAVGVTEEQGVPLSGVEVIFYAGTEASLGFRAAPPWSV
jgi:hypothetical protein